MHRWILALGILTLLVGPLAADGPSVGTIDGRVVDAQGDGLPGVTVTLSSDRGEQSTGTDADGAYRFTLLQASSYKITATLEGMGSSEGVVGLTTGQRQTYDLSLGATSESIIVTAESALVDKYQVGAVSALEADVAEQLSFKGRNYQASIEALPGVVHDFRSRFQGDFGFMLNGGEQGETAGFIDGVDTSFARHGGSPRTMLPTTSLEEVSLQDAGFGVEYGRVSAGVTNAVVKSGTNTFHGQFLYIPQNQDWRAPYEYTDIPRKDEIIDSFEANLGGSIVQDKAWFFVSYADQNTNQVDFTADGSVEEVSFKVEIPVVKINLQPNDRNAFTGLYIDSPIEKFHANARTGDRFALCACNLPGEVMTASWAFTINSSAFLELKIASQENTVNRSAARARVIDPNASPHSPLGNNLSYQDRRGNIGYNTIGQAAGEGFITGLRDQANVALSLYRGNNELKFGVDYQDLEDERLNIIGHRFFGRGYDENAAGGFAQPDLLEVYDPAAATTTNGEILSLYAQDRLSVGDKWVFNLGLRLDQQEQFQDIGIQTVDWTEVAPRVAMSYDTKADGSFLIRATLGRYYNGHTADFSPRLYGSLPNGRNLFDRFGWNPATQLYDIFQTRITPADANSVQQIDPNYKDEITLGFAWQFSDLWVFETTGILWELDDLWMATSQFDDDGFEVIDVRTWGTSPFKAERKYEGVRLGLKRSMRNNWMASVNYTWSNGEGNNFGAGDNTVTWDDALFEALGGAQVGTGATDATIVNRYGHGFSHRDHNLNIVGVKRIPIGSHNISLGGYFGFRGGEYWGLRRNTFVQHPVSRQRIRTSSYSEPRDAQQMEDTFNLNLTAQWNFPIRGPVQGRIGLEAANVTDEQELIGINRANGRPFPGVAAYQIPREYRLQIGFVF